MQTKKRWRRWIPKKSKPTSRVSYRKASQTAPTSLLHQVGTGWHKDSISSNSLILETNRNKWWAIPSSGSTQQQRQASVHQSSAKVKSLSYCLRSKSPCYRRTISQRSSKMLTSKQMETKTISMKSSTRRVSSKFPPSSSLMCQRRASMKVEILATVAPLNPRNVVKSSGINNSSLLSITPHRPLTPNKCLGKIPYRIPFQVDFNRLGNQQMQSWTTLRNLTAKLCCIWSKTKSLTNFNCLSMSHKLYFLPSMPLKQHWNNQIKQLESTTSISK